MTQLSQHALETTYEDVKHLIYKMVHAHIRKHGNLFGDFDELLSIAHVRFLEAYQSYIPECGSAFTTWLAINVQKGGFLELVRTTARRHGREDRIIFDSTILDTEFDPSTNRIADLLEYMTDDAQIITNYVLSTPADDLREQAGGRGRYGLIAAIRRHFIHEGWQVGRIHSAFRQISEALGGQYALA